MNWIALALAVLAIACGGFAYWGLHTAAGQRRFDEMAGMIPFFAAIAAGVLGVAAAAVWVIARLRA